MRLLGLTVLAMTLASCQQRGWLANDIDNLRAEIAQLEKDVPKEGPLWITEGDNAFSTQLEDYSPRVPDFVYNHIIQKLSKMSEAEFEKMAESNFDVQKFFDTPSEERGKVWHVHGMIASVDAEPFFDPDLPEIKWVYSGTVFVGDKPLLFHCIQKPDVMYLGNDSVDFTGIFIKILSYKSRAGSSASAPFFIAKSVKKFY